MSSMRVKAHTTCCLSLFCITLARPPACLDKATLWVADTQHVDKETTYATTGPVQVQMPLALLDTLAPCKHCSVMAHTPPTHTPRSRPPVVASPPGRQPCPTASLQSHHTPATAAAIPVSSIGVSKSTVLLVLVGGCPAISNVPMQQPVTTAAPVGRICCARLPTHCTGLPLSTAGCRSTQPLLDLHAQKHTSPHTSRPWLTFSLCSYRMSSNTDSCCAE